MIDLMFVGLKKHNLKNIYQFSRDYCDPPHRMISIAHSFSTHEMLKIEIACPSK